MTDQPTPAASGDAPACPVSALDPLGRVPRRQGDPRLVLRWREQGPHASPAPAAPPPPPSAAIDAPALPADRPRRPRLGLRWAREDSPQARNGRG